MIRHLDCGWQVYGFEVNFYYNRHGYYDPDSCQYLTPDPIGIAGGLRPSSYVSNPMEWVDPLGLSGGSHDEDINQLDPVLEYDRDGNEIMYRTMSEAHVENLKQNGVLLPTTETSVSPLLSYSSKYDGTTVKLITKPGTSKKLQDIGIAANEPASKVLPNLSTKKGAWMKEHSRFKVEKGQMTTQLGQGKAIDIFNENLVYFDVL